MERLKMKLKKNDEKKFFATFIDTSEWEDGRVVLTAKEREIIRQAYEICDKADSLTRKANHDEDYFNSYGEASNGLFSVLELQPPNNACNRPASAVGMQSEILESAGG